MKNKIKIFGIIVLCLLSSSCNSLSNKAFSKLGYEKIDQANQQIDNVKKDAAAQISANTDKIRDEEKQIANISFQKDQLSANALFGAEVDFSLISNPDRPEVVINTNVQIAASFLPPPTNTAIQTALVNARKEFDLKQTTDADLTKKLQDAQNQAQVLVAQQKNAQDTITALKVTNDQILNNADDKINTIQASKDTTEKNLLSSQQQTIANAQDVEKLKEKIMWATGILALLCIAAAIWVPVFKTESIEGAVLMGFITVSIPYIQGWMIGAAGGVILLAILFKIGLQHNTAVKTIAASTNMPIATVAKAIASNTTALLVNDPISTPTILK